MGFTRVNFNYFLTDDDVDYILDAIEFVCRYGWMFLPHYKFDQDIGNWVNREEQEQKQRSWLGEIDYSQGSMQYLSSRDKALRGTFPFYVEENCVEPMQHYMDSANKALVETVEQYKTIYGKSVVDQTLLVPDEYQHLIWFLFPSEILPDLLKLKFKSPLSFETIVEFN